jgi:hypothetical protein
MVPSRIWEVAPYLCGLPTEVAKRTVLLVLKAFFDETGKGDPHFFAMGGFIARAEEWAKFNDDWRSVLDEPPRLEYFHMTEAVAQKDFGRIKELGAIIRRHKFQPFLVEISMDDYNTLVRGHVGPHMDSPYFLAYYLIISLVIQWELDNDIDEPVDFIFDEQYAESDGVQAAFTPIIESMPPEIRRRFGSRPIHVDDKKHPPLQAADMLIWPFQRIMAKVIAKEPIDEFLTDLFTDIPVPRRFQLRGKELAFFVEDSRKRLRAKGKVFAYDFMIASRGRDFIYGEHNRRAIANAASGETVNLLVIQAKGMGRFLLVHTCPLSDTPHLHRRSSGECLAAPKKSA